jgi:pimeloyl-ACP methyl ester carboxylesterase
LPDSRIRAVPDAVHMVNEDNPTGFNELVMDFLEEA